MLALAGGGAAGGPTPEEAVATAGAGGPCSDRPAARAPATQLEARAWALIDARSGRCSTSHAGRKRLPVASTTKLMTAYVALHDLPLDRIVRAAPYHPTYGESLLGLRRGQRISVRDLLYGLILRSGNDAAYDLARAAAGSEAGFVAPDEPACRGPRPRRHPLRQPDRPRPARQLLERPGPDDADPAPPAHPRLRQDRRLPPRRPDQPAAAAADRHRQRAAADGSLGERGEDRPHVGRGVRPGRRRPPQGRRADRGGGRRTDRRRSLRGRPRLLDYGFSLYPRPAPIRPGRAIPTAAAPAAGGPRDQPGERPGPGRRFRFADRRDPHRSGRVRDTDWQQRSCGADGAAEPKERKRSGESRGEARRGPARAGTRGSPGDSHRDPERRDRSHRRGAELPPRASPPRGREPHRRRGQGDQRRPRAQPDGPPGDRHRVRRRADRHPGARAAARGVGADRLHPDRRRDADQPRGDRPDLRRADRDQRARPGGQPGGGRDPLRADRLPGGRGEDLRAGRVASARRRRRPLRPPGQGPSRPRRHRRARRRGRGDARRPAGRRLDRHPQRARGRGAGRPGVRRPGRPRQRPRRAGPARRRGGDDHPSRRLRRGRSARAAERRFVEVVTDPLDPVSTVGSGDAFLAGFVAARYEGRSPEECLAFGVACGAESTQHFGAGVVDPNQVERILPAVEVRELEVPVEV